MKKISAGEKGDVTVEAAVIFPLAILIVIILLYLSIILFQKANLHAGLETALAYYKPIVTDMFVSADSGAAYRSESSAVAGKGNSYNSSAPLNPYDDLFGNVHNINSGDFKKFFDSIAGNMLFDGDVQIEINYTNYVLYKEFEAKAVQTIKLPVDFSFIGLTNEYTITASARVAVNDHDDIIRNTDYAVYLLKDTKLGEMTEQIAEKVKDYYEKFSNLLADK